MEDVAGKETTYIYMLAVMLIPQSLKQSKVIKDKRQKRDLHGLDKDGMVLCNPRDKEAAHRAYAEGIATDDWEMVTCRKCMLLIYQLNKASRKGRQQL